MTLFNVGEVVFLNVTSGISPDPDWQLGVVTRATNSYGWTAATTFSDQYGLSLLMYRCTVALLTPLGLASSDVRTVPSSTMLSSNLMSAASWHV